MIERNLQRANALHGFQGTRVYHLPVPGLRYQPGSRMVTSIFYQAPIPSNLRRSHRPIQVDRDKVFRKLLETEQEALKEENRARTASQYRQLQLQVGGLRIRRVSPSYLFQVEPRTPPNSSIAVRSGSMLRTSPLAAWRSSREKPFVLDQEK